jgi:integrase
MSAAGNITRRGKASWRLKFEGARDPATGHRNIQYCTVRGTKAEAKAKLAELVAAVSNSSYVEPSKVTVAEHVRARVGQWEAAYDPAAKTGISPKTAERYRELVANQIAPHIGAKLVQKLRPLDIEAWHAALRTTGRKDGKGGIATRTIKHAHRVLSQALDDAVKNEMAAKNVARLEGAPRVDDTEVQVVLQARIGELIDKLRGRAMYARAITSLFTGLRRGELLAPPWTDVDLDAKVWRVRVALEETKEHGVQVKAPKTTAGKRDVSLPEIVVAALREHRRQQLELRMALGLGKLPDDALVFPAPLKGGHQSPRAFSKEWAQVAASIGFPGLSFHALRHTHASQLIEAGIDIVTISKRLGHAKPDITLRVYAHLFTKDDSKASDAINAALAGLGRA